MDEICEYILGNYGWLNVEFLEGMVGLVYGVFCFMGFGEGGIFFWIFVWWGFGVGCSRGFVIENGIGVLGDWLLW